ncbi:MAG: hypothetical protein ACR2N3_12625 [Pyrinomonadaceae bacterium]
MFNASEAEKNLSIIDENPQIEKILADFFRAKYVCGEAVSVDSSLGKIRASGLNTPKMIACLRSPYQAALEELRRCAGTQFDPSVVEAFWRIPKEDWEIPHRRSLAERQEILSFQSVVAKLVHSKQIVEMVH